MNVLEEFSKVIAKNRAVNPIFLKVCAMFKVFAITLLKVVKFSLKANYLLPNSSNVRSLLSIFFLLHLTAIVSPGLAQIQPAPSSVKSDTSRVSADSLQTPPKGDIETTINCSARDSINSSIDGQIVRL